MARTNLFKPLTNPTGNFYMFSQYADDLTKEASQKNTYKVIPSKFAAVELDAQALYELAQDRGESDVNVSICSYLQRSYENSCAFFKSNTNVPDLWNNFMASRLLWQNLLMYKFIHLQEVTNDNVTQYVCPEIKYVGDINIYTNKEYDGIMYNEIYCYIPTDVKEGLYLMTCTDEDGSTYSNAETYTYDDPNGYLVGWNTNNYPSNLVTAGVPNSALFGYDDDGTTQRVGAYTIRDGWWLYPQALSHSESESTGSAAYKPTEAASFNVNAIIIFYDVYDSENDTYIYRNLPLGMYFTGIHNNGTSDGITVDPEFSNTILKYVNNNDIYGQGTSYGLRVLTKYVCTPNSLFYIDSVFEVDDLYPEYYKLMEEMAETVDAANRTIDGNRAFHQDIKDHLAMFKNYRTNVPYIRMVNGMPYWFVNGRNTGQPAVSVTETSINMIDVVSKIRQHTVFPADYSNPSDPYHWIYNDPFIDDPENPGYGTTITYWEVYDEKQEEWVITPYHATLETSQSL